SVLHPDHEGRMGAGVGDVEVADVALLLEDAGDLDLQLRVRHLRAVVQRLVGVADAREHVGYGICEHGSSYQELLVMPGMTPWWASSRRQIRQSPNFLNTARGRPHLPQRLYLRVLNFCGRAALAIKLFLATLLLRREGKAQAAQKRLCLLVRLGGCRDRDVEAADLVDAVVVDLRKDDLFAQTERVVAAPVE